MWSPNEGLIVPGFSSRTSTTPAPHEMWPMPAGTKEITTLAREDSDPCSPNSIQATSRHFFFDFTLYPGAYKSPFSMSKANNTTPHIARMHDEEQLDDAPCDMISDGSAGSLLQCDSNTSIDKARRYEMACRLAPNKQSPLFHAIYI